MSETDIFNKFGVGMNGQGIVLLLPPRAPMSNDDALNLAAWLVALADRDDRFNALRAVVENS